jgi:hypothetical protein
MGAELIFLVLIAVVLVFGLGVMLVSRTGAADDAAAARPSVGAGRPTAVEERSPASLRRRGRHGGLERARSRGPQCRRRGATALRDRLGRPGPR